jgi:DNA-directed RNA polymerase specialized sigma24 family protein
VAERFGLTRHAARRAVVDGSLSLALRLGDADALSKRERDVCRQILLEGSSIAETARELRLTETQVRSALASARARMVAQLK